MQVRGVAVPSLWRDGQNNNTNYSKEVNVEGKERKKVRGEYTG